MVDLGLQESLERKKGDRRLVAGSGSTNIEKEG